MQISSYMTDDHVKADEELESSLKKIREGSWDEALRGFELASRRIKFHIYLEEEKLFPALKNDSEIVNELMMQHVSIWDLLDQIYKGISERNKETEIKMVLLMQILKVHNSIEEHIIYEELDRAFDNNPNIVNELMGSKITDNWKPKMK
ncbi:MAG: hemerythrin domain-containing protein [Saccharolobus sp.]